MDRTEVSKLYPIGDELRIVRVAPSQRCQSSWENKQTSKQTNSSSRKEENKKEKKRWSSNEMLHEWDGTRDICFSVMTHWPRFAQSILHDLRLNSTQSSPSHSVSKFLKFKGVLYDCTLLTKSSFNTLVHAVFIRVLSFSVGGQSHISGSSQVDTWPFLETVSTD